MTFWQENYAFIKDVYDMRHHKMAEWIENVEKVRKYYRADKMMMMTICLQAISRIMADKVYTSAEFKRERDSFHVSKIYRYSNIAMEFLKHDIFVH